MRQAEISVMEIPYQETIDEIHKVYKKCMDIRKSYYNETSHGMKAAFASAFKCKGRFLLALIDDLLGEPVDNPMKFKEMRFDIMNDLSLIG